MPVHIYNKKTKRYNKVAEYDTSLMLTLKGAIPNDPATAKELLIKTKDAPAGKLRDIYHTKDNSALIRKIFVVCLKAILLEISMGRCKFIVPQKGKFNPAIYMGELRDDVVQGQRKRGKLNKFDLLMGDYKIPYLKYKMSPGTRRPDLMIYVNKTIYQEIVDHANSGQKFSKRPRKIDYFLPVVYEEFSYIKEQQLERIVKYCFSKLHRAIKKGEEIRVIDGEGEIRFFRALGRHHDKVMRKVVKTRLTQERNKRYGAIS